MPQINLSTLSGPELRQMLDSSRRQGDAVLSYKVLQEMAARREAPPERKSRGKRRPAEPRGFVVDLEEAPETSEDDVPPMPYWVAPSRGPEPEAVAAEAPEPAPAAPAKRGARRRLAPDPAPVAANSDIPPMQDEPPLSLTDTGQGPEPGQWSELGTEALSMSEPDDLRLSAQEPEPPRAGRQARPPRPARRGGRMVLGFLLGGVLGVGLGWWGGGVYREVVGPGSAPVRTAALSVDTSPAAPPAATATPAETGPSTAAVEGAVTPAAEGATTPPVSTPVQDQAPAEAAPPAPPAAAAPTPPVRVAEAAPKDDAARSAPERPAQVVAGVCTSEPTPADRTICGDPDLRRLQRELQRAYAQALAAHEDRTLLRERQLAWRDARNTVTDPDRLIQLYQDRIRKLNAATAEARRLKDGA